MRQELLVVTQFSAPSPDLIEREAHPFALWGRAFQEVNSSLAQRGEFLNIHEKELDTHAVELWLDNKRLGFMDKVLSGRVGQLRIYLCFLASWIWKVLHSIRIEF